MIYQAKEFWSNYSTYLCDQTIIPCFLCISKSRNNRNSKNMVQFWLILCRIRKHCYNYVSSCYTPTYLQTRWYYLQYKFKIYKSVTIIEKRQGLCCSRNIETILFTVSLTKFSYRKFNNYRKRVLRMQTPDQDQVGEAGENIQETIA